jgi:hypothetical protein
MKKESKAFIAYIMCPPKRENLFFFTCPDEGIVGIMAEKEQKKDIRDLGD